MVPKTETEYQEVTEVENYEVEVPRWVNETREVEVPKTVRRGVSYDETESIPRTIMMKVPVDICGNELGPATPLSDSTKLINKSGEPVSDSRNFSPLSIGESTIARREPSLGSSDEATRFRTDFMGTSPGKDETSERRPSSVLVPLTEPTAAKPRGELQAVESSTNDTPKQPSAENTSSPVQNISDINELASKSKSGESAKTFAETVSRVDSNLIAQPAMPDDASTTTGDEAAADRANSAPALNGG